MMQRTGFTRFGFYIFAASLLFATSCAFSQVGALLFCPDTAISPEDSAWVVETESSNTPRDSLTTPPGILSEHTPQPAYPDSALAHAIPGSVIIAAYVDKQGQVMAWQSLRVDPENWGFEDAVNKVICQWQFIPAMRQGTPVNGIIGVPFNFELDAAK
jgi:TonB family protein